MTEDEKPAGSNPLRILRYAAWAAVAVAVLALGGWTIQQRLSPRDDTLTRETGDALIESKFSLTDQTGRRVTEADYAGRWQLVYFGYTNCPDQCPTTLAFMARVIDLLGDKADQVAPLFITVDPKRDTVAVMATFVAAFSPRLIGLTGSEAETAAAAHAFRVFYEPAPDAKAPDGYLMAHSGYIYLMTPKGRYEAVFLENGATGADLAADILMRIAKGDPS